MHTFKLTLGFLLISLSLFSQDITFSDYLKVRDQHDLFIIGGDEQGGFVGIGEDYYHQGLTNRQVISYYDRQQGLQASKIIKPEKKSSEYFYSFYFQQQLHLLQYDAQAVPETGQYPIYLESYDTSLTKKREERAIGQLSPFIFTYDMGSLFRSYFSSQYGKIRRSFFYDHRVSNDQTKVALLFNYAFFGSASSDFQVTVLQEDMQTAWSAPITLPDRGDSYQLLEDYTVSNDGILYLLVAHFDNKNFKKSASGFEYRLYAYDPNQESLEAIEFETDGKFITNLGLKLNQQQQPVLAGIYADATTNSILGGLRIQESVCTTFAFKTAEVNEINGDRDQDYAQEYTVKNMVLEEDGSVVFFAESYKRGPIVKARISLSGISPIDADIELGDIYQKIVATKIGPNSDHWIKIIDKTQRSSEPRDVFTSFAFTYDDDGYYLLFNNNIRSMSDVSLVTISDEGDISLKVLFDRSTHRLRVVPAFATSLYSGLMMVPVEKNNKQAVATINLQQHIK